METNGLDEKSPSESDFSVYWLLLPNDWTSWQRRNRKKLFCLCQEAPKAVWSAVVFIQSRGAEKNMFLDMQTHYFSSTVSRAWQKHFVLMQMQQQLSIKKEMKMKVGISKQSSAGTSLPCWTGEFRVDPVLPLDPYFSSRSANSLLFKRNRCWDRTGWLHVTC